MSLDLTQIIDLSRNGMTLITSDDINNSAFVVPTLLSSKVKQIRSHGQSTVDSPVIILVTLNQSYAHFASVLARSFGLNLNTYRDSGKLVSIDLLKNLNDFITDGHFDFNLFRSKIMSSISLIPTTANVNSLVIFDDISILHTVLSVDYKLIYHLFLQIWSLMTSKMCHLIIQSHLLTLNEDIGDFNNLYDLCQNDCNEENIIRLSERKLIFSLSSLSTNWLNFSKLQTGYSAQYNGSFICLTKKIDNECHTVTQVESKRYLYKSHERNTKIFLPGLN